MAYEISFPKRLSGSFLKGFHWFAVSVDGVKSSFPRFVNYWVWLLCLQVHYLPKDQALVDRQKENRQFSITLLQQWLTSNLL